jgi:hypothetical protein
MNMRKSDSLFTPRPSGVRWLLLGLLVLGSSGCYTVLQHPPVQDNLRLISPDPGRNCLACHDPSGFDANVWSQAHLSPAARLGSYQYFRDYPWWWAEPRVIAQTLRDSSTVAVLPPSAGSSGLAGVFNRLRASVRDTAADSSRGATVAPDQPEKEKKKPTPEFQRRRR